MSNAYVDGIGMGALYQTIVEVLLTFPDSDQSDPVVGEMAIYRQQWTAPADWALRIHPSRRKRDRHH